MTAARWSHAAFIHSDQWLWFKRHVRDISAVLGTTAFLIGLWGIAAHYSENQTIARVSHSADLKSCARGNQVRASLRVFVADLNSRSAHPDPTIIDRANEAFKDVDCVAVTPNN